jgi:hypothetical protein
LVFGCWVDDVRRARSRVAVCCVGKSIRRAQKEPKDSKGDKATKISKKSSSKTAAEATAAADDAKATKPSTKAPAAGAATTSSTTTAASTSSVAAAGGAAASTTSTAAAAPKKAVDDSPPGTPPEMAVSTGGGDKGSTIDKDTIIQAHGQSYKALQVVGTGSFGVVIQAQVVETGELVAIKKVLQDKRFKVRRTCTIDLHMLSLLTIHARYVPPAPLRRSLPSAPMLFVFFLFNNRFTISLFLEFSSRAAS